MDENRPPRPLNPSPRPSRGRASRSAPRILAALAALGGLAGCFLEPERKAGVDDFPNSIYASVDGYLAENRRAEGLEARPPADSLLAHRTYVGPAFKASAGAAAALPPLAKLAARAAAGCASQLTMTGPEKIDGTRITLETLVLCLDTAWFDTVTGNEHIVSAKSVTRDSATGRVETGEFSDADGDGFLNPVPGGASKALMRLRVEDGGVIEETRLVVGGGADGDFKTSGDNPTYSLSWSRVAARDGLVAGGDVLAAGDTLASASIADADSDGVAIDVGRPGLADVAWFARGPTGDDPDAAWSRFRMVAPAQDGKVQAGRPARFSAESETRVRHLDGVRRRNRIRILDLGGGEDAGGDTVLARFTTTGSAPTDTLDSLETTLTMRIGDFEDDGDDTVYALEVRVAKRLGEERTAAFAFRSDRPIPHGEDPEAGSLSLRAGYADGTALDVEGTLSAGTLDVIAKLRDGKRVRAVWDRTGEGISLEALD